MSPLSWVSIKYLDQKCAAQNPDFQLILKRNKLSGTMVCMVLLLLILL